MATQTNAVAHVYAKSLFELAEEAGGPGKIAEIAGEMEEICELLRSDRAFAEFMSSPIIERSKRTEALSRIFSDRITDLTLRFLLVLNAKGRLGDFESVATAFDQIVQERHGRVEVDVFTAEAIDAAQLTQIEQRVREALQRDPVLHPYVDPKMIGGIKLRIGDQLIDGSVATRLRRMRQNLMRSGSAGLRERIRQVISEDTTP